MWFIACVCGATHLCVTSPCPYQSWQHLFLLRGYMLGARTKCTATLFTHLSASWMMLANSRMLEIPCDISKNSFCARFWAKSTQTWLWTVPSPPFNQVKLRAHLSFGLLWMPHPGMCLPCIVPSWEQENFYSQVTHNHTVITDLWAHGEHEAFCCFHVLNPQKGLIFITWETPLPGSSWTLPGKKWPFHWPCVHTAHLRFVQDPNTFILFFLALSSLSGIDFLKWCHGKEFGLSDELVLLEFELLLFSKLFLSERLCFWKGNSGGSVQ